MFRPRFGNALPNPAEVHNRHLSESIEDFRLGCLAADHLGADRRDERPPVSPQEHLDILALPRREAMKHPTP
jgi:hypothetical protein